VANSSEIDIKSALALSDMAKVRLVLDKIADKWTIMILTVLCKEPARFNEIKRRLDGITHKALADALKRLERHGLITRTVLANVTPIGVQYGITSIGLSLRTPFEALCAWALANGAAIDLAGADYDGTRQDG
jgi:DNA-binding HxlR family transcriptional regulator